jgi:excisionase family DNA binding protein
MGDVATENPNMLLGFWVRVPRRSLVLSVEEAALVLRVSTRTIQRWIAAGSLVTYQPHPRGSLRVLLPALFQARLDEVRADLERRAVVAAREGD